MEIADRFAGTGPCKDLLDNGGMSVQDIVIAAARAAAIKTI
jgi:hypothetical protein